MRIKDTRILDGLREQYALEDAKREIDGILAPYAPECEVCFGTLTAEIVDSYKVSSQLDRHRICAIISRTDVTSRSYEDLSAEWRFHNIAWNLHFMRKNAKDVSLDYKKDPRISVRIVTALLDLFDIE